MSIINKTIISVLLIFFPFSLMAEEVKKVGKFKDWEVMVVAEASGKVCFAQSIPVLQAPKKDKRDARLFVTFRPSEKISNDAEFKVDIKFFETIEEENIYNLTNSFSKEIIESLLTESVSKIRFKVFLSFLLQSSSSFLFPHFFLNSDNPKLNVEGL